MILLPPPRDEAELVERLRRLAGRTLASIAALQEVEVPPDQRRAKGWTGQLLERALGASAGSRAEPDFPALGIELKSIPVDARGAPTESTFVSSLDLAALDLRWEQSGVRKKLTRIAWVPIEAEPTIPLAQRRVCAALLWSPSPDEEALLRGDYEELVELIGEGFFSRVTGERGTALQLRPKGRNAAHLRGALDEEGAASREAPRAFYLRPSFTGSILRRHFQLP